MGVSQRISHWDQMRNLPGYPGDPAVINDASTSATQTWSAQKLFSSFAGKAAFNHNHNSLYYNKTEVDTFVNGKPSINDAAIAANSVWSSTKINTELAAKSIVGHTHSSLEVVDLAANLADIQADVDSTQAYSEAVLGDLTSHAAETAPHSATASDTADRLVLRNATGGFDAKNVNLGEVTLRNTGTPGAVTNQDHVIATKQDISNTNASALYIQPATLNNSRLFVGAPSLGFYAVNFTYSSNVEDFPPVLQFKGGQTPGWIGGTIQGALIWTSTSGDNIALIPASERATPGYITGAGSKTGPDCLRSIRFKSYAKSDDAKVPLAAYEFETNEATLGVPHTLFKKNGTNLLNVMEDGSMQIKDVASEPASPPAGYITLFSIAGVLKTKTSAGVVTTL